MGKHYDVVAAVVVGQGRVMCLRKGVTRYAYTSHRWEFPGGKIEPGESPQQALHRELLEELDLDVTVGEHLLTVDHSYPDFSISLNAYWCEVGTGVVHLTEHDAVKWLPPQQLCSLPWCAADEAIAQAVAHSFALHEQKN